VIQKGRIPMDVKKLSRRQFLIAAGALAGTSALTACGAGGTEAPAVAPTEAPIEPTTASLPDTSQGTRVFAELEPPPEPPPFDGQPVWEPPDLTGQTLLLWGLDYDPHVERYGVLAETFTKRTGCEVKVEPQAWPIDEKIMAVMAAGAPPDAVCWMGKMLGPLIAQDAVLPVDDLVFDAVGLDVDKWWRPGAIGAYVFDGQHWGVPVEDNNNGYAVCGRIDLIAEASDTAKEIWSWAEENIWLKSYEDLFTLAAALQQEDDAGTVTIWGLNSNGWDQHSLLSIQRGLGEWWWDNENKQFNLDNDAMVEAFRLLSLEPLERGIEGILGMTHVNAFVAGQVALARGSVHVGGEAAKMGIEATVVGAPPPIEGEVPLYVGEGGWGFEVLRGAANEEAGIEFLKFMCTYEAQYIYTQIYGGYLPANNSVAQSDIYAGDHPVKVGVRRAVEALKNCVYWGNEMGIGGQVYDFFLESSDMVREKSLTPQEAAAKLQADCTALYEQFVSEA
jgi:ABC-type glycerol-3-phosphate transport system substrate-binding protein